MDGGIIFRSLRKTLLALQALSWHCPLLLFCLFFFTIYCSTAVAVPFYPMQLFFYFAIAEEVIFSRRSKINNLVLFDDDVTSFSSFSSPVMKQNLLVKTFVKQSCSPSKQCTKFRYKSLLLTTSLR